VSVDTRPPIEIAIAETADWTLDLSEFRPGDGWAVAYYFRGPAEVDVEGVADGDEWDFSIGSATFDVAGGYQWTAVATDGTERCRIATGRIRVLANAEDQTGLGDVTTHAERMLAALEAALEGTASKAHRSYTIDGRSLERMTLEELRTNRDLYARRVQLERELAAKGVSSAPKRVAVRLR